MTATARLVSAAASAAECCLEGRADDAGDYGASACNGEGGKPEHRAPNDAVEGDEAHPPEQEGLDRDDDDRCCGGEEVSPEAVGGAVPLADELRGLLVEEPERFVQPVEEVRDPHHEVVENAPGSPVEAEAVVGVVQLSHQRDAEDEHHDENRREHREGEGEDLVLPRERHEEAEELPCQVGEGADARPRRHEGDEGGEKDRSEHGNSGSWVEKRKNIEQKSIPEKRPFVNAKRRFFWLILANLCDYSTKPMCAFACSSLAVACLVAFSAPSARIAISANSSTRRSVIFR